MEGMSTLNDITKNARLGGKENKIRRLTRKIVLPFKGWHCLFHRRITLMGKKLVEFSFEG